MFITITITSAISSILRKTETVENVNQQLFLNEAIKNKSGARLVLKATDWHFFLKFRVKKTN